MSTTTSIEWTDKTWNPLAGCTRVSEGCRNCYAERMAKRLQAMGNRGYEGTIDANGRWTGKVNLIPDALAAPLHWRKPCMIFVNSMSDMFHQAVPFELVDQVFAVMALCPQHTFQVLTKRPERMADYLSEMATNHVVKWGKFAGTKVPGRPAAIQRVISARNAMLTRMGKGHDMSLPAWPLPNCWLGTSIENQATADERIPHLLRCPAAVRFLSCEPLLGPIDLRQIPDGDDAMHFPLIREFACEGRNEPCKTDAGIDWVIVGGESGSGARPMHPNWARSLRDQCAAAGVPFFFKQWGEWVPICQAGDSLNGLYKPNRTARPDEDQNALDEIYGRTCAVDRRVLQNNGASFSVAESDAFLQGTDPMTMFKVGKKAAGRKLDDRTWDEMPATPSTAYTTGGER